MAGNDTLGAAKAAKKDEFYTRLPDIENELRYYRNHFKDKVILCNCDDPFESNFFKYFVLNFNKFGLRKLIATSYAASPIAGTQFNYSIDDAGQMSYTFGGSANNAPLKKAYKAVVNTVYDKTGNNAIQMVDVAELFKSGENELTELEGDGDFRSDECLAILGEADIVSTNPPFSLLREYMAVLIEHNKKFVIIGNQNSTHYRDIFPLLKDGSLWIGYNRVKKFDTPTGPQTFGNIGWFTNLDIKKHHENMILIKRYDPNRYPKYENLDAINVDSIGDIPCDYDGLIGVPDNFLDVYNPDQFEIIGLGCGNLAKEIGVEKNFRGRTDVAYMKDGEYKCPYSRIIIRNKHPEQPKEIHHAD